MVRNHRSCFSSSTHTKQLDPAAEQSLEKKKRKADCRKINNRRSMAIAQLDPERAVEKLIIGGL